MRMDLETGAAPQAQARDRSRQGRLLSLVIPMHNEAAVIGILFDRLNKVIPTLGIECEIICVDDGSRDATLSLLRERSLSDPRIRIVALARNFGKEAALAAGLDACRGDVVVPLDADLQDPPELIAEFLDRWERGYDVVYGVRSDRSTDSLGKRVTASMFYRVFNAMSDYPIPADTGDFRLMDRSVNDALRRLEERNRFNKGLFAWVGFRQTGVPYARPERAGGATSWGTPALWRLAIDGITSFSTLPLRIWSAVGLWAALAAFLAGVALILRVLIQGRDVPGYASLMVVVLFCFSVQMVAFGVMGEYLGRMYTEVKRRPVYITREAGKGEADGA